MLPARLTAFSPAAPKAPNLSVWGESAASSLAQDTFELARRYASAGTVPVPLMLTCDNAVTLLPNADDVYAQQVEAMVSAKHEVLMGYAWEDDSEGAKMLMAGIKELERRREGAFDTSRCRGHEAVHLRIVLDGSLVSTRAPALEKVINELNPTHVKAELAYSAFNTPRHLCAMAMTQS